MMKRLIIVAIATATLAGCANTSTLSGDVYSANQAKQVQQVTYGTIVSMEPVQIQAGSEANMIGTIGGAVIGGCWVTPSAAAPDAAWRPPQAPSRAAWPATALRARSTVPTASSW